MRREILTWEDVNILIDYLVPQFEQEFETMMLITRGGIIPGGLIAEALQIPNILTAAVDFPAEMESQKQKKEISRWFAWPKFIQFPESDLLTGRRVLVVDDVWGSGRTIVAVKNRISAAAGTPFTCVLHFNPYRNVFDSCKPDYYAAITDAYIIYPWEIDRGAEGVLFNGTEIN